MTYPPEPDVRLTYRDPLGGPFVATAVAELDEPEPLAPPPLAARRVRLKTATGTSESRRLEIGSSGTGGMGGAVGTGGGSGNGEGPGFGMLDNEILAGVRLARLNAGTPYPPEVTRLIAFEADSAHPVVYLEPLRGEPVGRQAGRLPMAQRRPFQISMLRGVLLLGGAGVAHRRLSPDTVRWDGVHVQITDFSTARLVGLPRSVAGAPPWQPPEQRPDRVDGTVTDRDDLWAAGKLIFYVLTGKDLSDPAQLEDHPDLRSLLAGVFATPGRRPRAEEVLSRLGVSAAVPRLGSDPGFERGRAAFTKRRLSKHPDLAHPDLTQRDEQPSDVSESVRSAPEPEKVPDPFMPARPSAVWLWLGALVLLAVGGYLAYQGW